MHKILFILLLLPTFVQAQHQQEISDRFDHYFSLKEQGEYQQFARYFPEELINILPEAQLSASITQTFDNAAFGIKIEQGSIDSISNLVKHAETGYVSVYYSFLMTIQMNEDSFGMFDFILQSLLNSVAADQIDADVTKGTIVVQQSSLIIAIRKQSDNWKFMEINDQLIDIAQKILPREIMATI